MSRPVYSRKENLGGIEYIKETNAIIDKTYVPTQIQLFPQTERERVLWRIAGFPRFTLFICLDKYFNRWQEITALSMKTILHKTDCRCCKPVAKFQELLHY